MVPLAQLRSRLVAPGAIALAVGAMAPSAFESGTLFNGPAALDRETAAAGNPAGLGHAAGVALNGALVHGRESGIDGGGLSLQGAGVGVSWIYHNGVERGRLQAGIGVPLARGLRAGILAARHSVGAGENWSWGAGVQWEPAQWLKFAYYADSLNAAWYEKGRQHLGLGLRPLAWFGAEGAALTVEYGMGTRGFETSALDHTRQRLSAAWRIFPGMGIEVFRQVVGGDAIGAGIRIQASSGQTLAYRYASPPEWGELYASVNRRPRASIGVPGRRVAWVKLEDALDDGPGPQGALAWSAHRGHVEVLDDLRRIRETPNLTAVVLHLGGLGCSWAAAREIREALLSVRSSGVRLVAYMETGSRINYYLASTAHSVVMPPSTYLNVRGYWQEITFYTELLDSLGVEAQFLRVGRYKSYPEIFTRTRMSQEWRENLESTLGDLWEVFLHDVSPNRGMGADSLRQLLSQPEIGLSFAQSKGLIDTTLYPDQLLEFAGGKGAVKYALYRREFLAEEWSEGPEVGVVQIDGEIVLGSNRRPGWLTRGAVGHQSIIEQLRRFRKDPAVRGVLLRIHSPGGSALASDLIYREVVRLTKSGKPVVVSVGGVCASGGYYIASAADAVVAQANAVVGSIGIFAGKVVLERLYERLHLHQERVATGPHADAASATRQWTAEEQKALSGYLKDFYNRFLANVREHRQLTDSVERAAEGRIFTGRQARALGLVDTLGGWEAALDVLRGEMGVREGSPLRLVSAEIRDWSPLALFLPQPFAAHLRRELEILAGRWDDTFLAYSPMAAELARFGQR